MFDHYWMGTFNVFYKQFSDFSWIVNCIFTFFIHIYIYVFGEGAHMQRCACGGQRTMSGEVSSPFLYMALGDRIQVVRLGADTFRCWSFCHPSVCFQRLKKTKIRKAYLWRNNGLFQSLRVCFLRLFRHCCMILYSFLSDWHLSLEDLFEESVFSWCVCAKRITLLIMLTLGLGS